MEETTPNSNNNVMVMGTIVVLIIVLIAGFFFIQSRSKNPVSPATQEQVIEVPADMATQESTTTLEAGSFYYKPRVINAKVGEKIKVVMTSKDMMHDFNIDELNVRMPITKTGNTNTVGFTADKAGTYEFYCSVANHRTKGQVGKLVVVP